MEEMDRNPGDCLYGFCVCGNGAVRGGYYFNRIPDWMGGLGGSGNGRCRCAVHGFFEPVDKSAAADTYCAVCLGADDVKEVKVDWKVTWRYHLREPRKDEDAIKKFNT